MMLKKCRDSLRELIDKNGFLVNIKLLSGINDSSIQTFFELLKSVIEISIYSKEDISLGGSLNNLGVDDSLINPIISIFTKNNFNFKSKEKLKKLYLNEIFILVS